MSAGAPRPAWWPTARRWGWRGARAVVALLLVVAVAFWVVASAPGDPLHLASELPADDPLAGAAWTTRFLRWAGGVLSFDLGRALDGRPVSEHLAQALPASLALGGLALATAWVLGFPLALFLASRPPGSPWRSLEAALLGLVGVPAFWLGLALSLLLASPRGWPLFPVQGLSPLPVLALALPLAAFTTRQVTEAVRAALSSDFALAARARGVDGGRLLWRHAARHGLVTAAALLGVELPAVLTGSVAVEVQFGIQGMGSLAFAAAQARDVPLAMGACLAVAVAAQLGLALSDALVAHLDPRQGGAP